MPLPIGLLALAMIFACLPPMPEYRRPDSRGCCCRIRFRQPSLPDVPGQHHGQVQ